MSEWQIGFIVGVAVAGLVSAIVHAARSPRSASPSVDPGSLDPARSQAVGALSDDSPQSSERGAAISDEAFEASLDAAEADRLLFAAIADEWSVTDEEASMMAVDLERQAPPQLTYEPIPTSVDRLIAVASAVVAHFDVNGWDDTALALLTDLHVALAMVQHPAGGGL